jgi:hypothetical protein
VNIAYVEIQYEAMVALSTEDIIPVSNAPSNQNQYAAVIEGRINAYITYEWTHYRTRDVSFSLMHTLAAERDNPILMTAENKTLVNHERYFIGVKHALNTNRNKSTVYKRLQSKLSVKDN